MSAQHHCINCGIGTWRSTAIGIHQLDDEGILSVIQQWIAPQVVNNSHHICQACRNLAVIAMGINESPPRVTTGHRQVCINCGRSVLRARSHVLRTDTERESMIRKVIREWIVPRSIPHGRALICHSCWVRADRYAHQFVGSPSGSSASQVKISQQGETSSSTLTTRSTREPPSLPTSTGHESLREPPSQSVQRQRDMIVLPDYIRAAETESRCFVEGCQRSERNRVPDSTRKMLLNSFNFYVPKNNRLCDLHNNTQSWDFLAGALENYVNVFTALHIQDMLLLKGLQ